MAEKFVRVRNTLVRLVKEEPKAECGHLFMISFAALLFAFFAVALMVMK